MDTTANPSLQDWLQQALRQAVQPGQPVAAQEDPFVFDVETTRRPLEIPPDQLPYLRKLIWAILDGRDIVAAYNYVLLALLGLFTVAHVLEKRRCRKRWRDTRPRLENTSSTAVVHDAEAEPGHCHASPGPSSSSSVSSGPGTPSGALKDASSDLERRPLLRASRPSPAATRSSAFLANKLRHWIEYQPRPLPLVHRALPPNGTSLFVLVWLGINVFFHLYHLPLQPEYFCCFADRAGCVFVVNLPLLYILAAKNQPVFLLTGRSYEALNIFHRRVGEWMCFEAFLHGAGMFLWRFALEPEWLQRDKGVWAYVTHPLILLGIGALVAYELLFFTSLGSFRQRWYERFLVLHVVLQVLALGFLYFHFFTARPYVLLALAIFVVDRVVWRLGLKSALFTAETHVLPDGETMFMSVEWTLPGPSSSWNLWPRRSIRHGWKPTDHVFLTVPALGRTHALQAHPFTIASAAPPPTAPGPDGAAKASLSLLIRSHQGFTADLLCYAHRHRDIPVRLDGPYGSSHALDMLRASDHALLVAGGSGIAVTFPLAWALLGKDGPRRDETETDIRDVTKPRPDGCSQREGCGGVVAPATRRPTVRMLWIIHSDEHRFWIPQEQLRQLEAAGLDLVIPPPTAEAGRPDVQGIVEGWMADACVQTEQIAMVVSGPDGLNRMVRNLGAQAMGKGADVRLAVEKFGW